MSSPLQGRPASPEHEAIGKASAEHWRTVINEAPLEELKRLEDAAKQLVALTGTLQGLYFAVFAFSDLPGRVSSALGQLLFLAPLALWLLSLLCATMVFVPQPRRGADLSDDRINSWQNVRDSYWNAGRQKLVWLRRAHLTLIASFVAVLLLLGSFVLLKDSAQSAPQPVVILTPTPLSPATP